MANAVPGYNDAFDVTGALSTSAWTVRQGDTQNNSWMIVDSQGIVRHDAAQTLRSYATRMVPFPSRDHAVYAALAGAPADPNNADPKDISWSLTVRGKLPLSFSAGQLEARLRYNPANGVSSLNVFEFPQDSNAVAGNLLKEITALPVDLSYAVGRYLRFEAIGDRWIVSLDGKKLADGYCTIPGPAALYGGFALFQTGPDDAGDGGRGRVGYSEFGGLDHGPPPHVPATPATERAGVIVYNRGTFLPEALLDVISAEWTEKLRGPGTFTAFMADTSTGAQYIVENALVTINNHPFFITKVERTSGDGRIQFSGVGAESMLEERIIVPPTGWTHDVLVGPAEDVMRTYVLRHAHPAGAGTRRGYPRFEFEDSAGRGARLRYEARYTNLADALDEIGKASGYGWGVRFDHSANRLLFETLVGTDRSTSVILAAESEQTYLRDVEGHKTLAYVAGQGEGTERQVVDVPLDERAAVHSLRRANVVDATKGAYRGDGCLLDPNAGYTIEGWFKIAPNQLGTLAYFSGLGIGMGFAGKTTYNQTEDLGNLMIDPGAETTGLDWHRFEPTTGGGRSTGSTATGTYKYYLQRASTSSFMYINDKQTRGYIRAAEGQVITISVAARNSTTSGAAMNIGLAFLDKNGNILRVDVTSPAVTATYVRYTYTSSPAPAGTWRVRPYVTTLGGATTDQLWFDDVVVTNPTGGSYGGLAVTLATEGFGWSRLGELPGPGWWHFSMSSRGNSEFQGPDRLFRAWSPEYELGIDHIALGTFGGPGPVIGTNRAAGFFSDHTASGNERVGFGQCRDVRVWSVRLSDHEIRTNRTLKLKTADKLLHNFTMDDEGGYIYDVANGLAIELRGGPTIWSRSPDLPAPIAYQAPSGYDLREAFIDQRDVEIGKESAVTLTDRALADLVATQPVTSFTVAQVEQGDYVYGRDFHLGDLVTARNPLWGIKSTFQVVETHATLTAGRPDYEIVLDQPYPDEDENRRQSDRRRGAVGASGAVDYTKGKTIFNAGANVRTAEDTVPAGQNKPYATVGIGEAGEFENLDTLVLVWATAIAGEDVNTAAVAGVVAEVSFDSGATWNSMGAVPFQTDKVQVRQAATAFQGRRGKPGTGQQIQVRAVVASLISGTTRVYYVSVMGTALAYT